MSKISLKHSGGNVVSLNSPTSAPTSADVAFKLPNADGTSGQAIVTDGSGNLSFAGTGKILQVVQAGRNDTASQSTASEALWTGHNIQVTITPSNSSNKILIIANTHFTSSNDVNNIPVILQKQTGSGSFASITAANGAIVGSRTGVMTAARQYGTYSIIPQSFAYLDTAGSTSALTYRVAQYNTSGSTRTLYINQFHNDSDGGDNVRTSSWIQVMEVAA